MDNLNIMIVGVGGQGTLLASRILGAVALKKIMLSSFLKYMAWLREAVVL
jgi:Pyruvate:ferredoxin oxidoreductase and related 2-oxoacid:ferredoxin oxidoreductases, gamma subunit